MLYGTLPIVRGTGGLCDSVENYDEHTSSGSGFVFHQLDREAYLGRHFPTCRPSFFPTLFAYLKAYEHAIDSHGKHT
ncbi:MAG: hypothetical protein LBJ94_02365 [Puniceicoccales bacterium]|nr:hypothetical protein [Puniceicoccales bacterium]